MHISRTLSEKGNNLCNIMSFCKQVPLVICKNEAEALRAIEAYVDVDDDYEYEQEISSHEMFLMKLPFLNPLVSQILLSKYSLFRLLSKSNDNCIFQQSCLFTKEQLLLKNALFVS